MNGKNVGLLLVAVFFIGFGVWFYSEAEQSTGIIDSKWVETTTSTTCDDEGKNCRTTTTHQYYVQLRDGRIYTALFGTLQWDRLQPGMSVTFESRGRRLHFFGWRAAVPTIVSIEAEALPQ